MLLLKKNKKADRWEWVILLIGVTILLLGCLLGGCKTIQTSEQVVQRDSVVYHHRYDTTHFTITDTTHIVITDSLHEQHNTTITFAGSGSYNSQTGEAQNVASVQTTADIRRLQQSNIQKGLVIDSLQARLDSANTTIRDLQSSQTIVSNDKLNGWERFIMGCGYALLGLLLIGFIILIVKIAIKLRGL